jgi:hypothetical protein
VWNVTGYDAGGNSLISDSRKVSGATVDLNSTTEQSITIAHDLPMAPYAEDVSTEILYSGSNTTWELAYIRVKSVDATNVDLAVKLRVAAGAAETANLMMKAKL